MSILYRQQLKLSFKQGEDVSYEFIVKDKNTLQPINIFGSVVTAQIRDGYEGEVVATFTGQTLSTTGKFKISLTKSQTAAIIVSGKQKLFVFDVDLTLNDGTTHTYIDGTIVVMREITRT